MKQQFFIIFGFVFLVLSVDAQIGINTRIPIGIFHIDPKADTNASGSSGITDDLLVTNTGRLGLGVANPTNKLHIKPAVPTKGFRLEDGNEQQGKVLLSDEYGNGRWGTLSFGSRGVLWHLSNPAFTFSGTDDLYAANANSNVTFFSDIKNVVYTVNSLTIPSGTYLAVLTGDLVGAEYANVKLAGNYSGSPGTERVFIEMNYEHALSTLAFVNFSDEIKLSIKVQLLNSDNNIRVGTTAAQAGTLNPPVAANGWYELNLVKLE